MLTRPLSVSLKQLWRLRGKRSTTFNKEKCALYTLHPKHPECIFLIISLVNDGLITIVITLSCCEFSLVKLYVTITQVAFIVFEKVPEFFINYHIFHNFDVFDCRSWVQNKTVIIVNMSIAFDKLNSLIYFEECCSFDKLFYIFVIETLIIVVFHKNQLCLYLFVRVFHTSITHA